MQELTSETIGAYLSDRGLVSARATLLSGGVSANVFRVASQGGRFVVKQSCPQLRTRDVWLSDVGRIFREIAVMRALGEFLPETVVPRVLWVDEVNFAFAMSHAPGEQTTWKDELLSGIVDIERAKFAGDLLGTIHQASHQQPKRFAEFADVEVFRQLRIDPFYGTVAKRLPEAAEQIVSLIRDLHDKRIALCLGDFTPKNMLVHGHQFTLVDYETATLGEPAFDVGLFLAHVLLKSLNCPRRNDEFRAAIEGFRAAYNAAAPSLARPEYDLRIRKHLGACLLSRTDGTSPVGYLSDAGRRQARDWGIAFLAGDAPELWRHVFNVSELAR